MKFVNTAIVASFGVLFLICLIYLTTFSFYGTGCRVKLSQLDYLCTTCEVAKQLAAEHFKKGERNLMVVGMPGEGKLADTYRVLETDYKVTLISTGCIGLSDELECYNRAMEQLLQKMYGNDFYEKAFAKADK